MDEALKKFYFDLYDGETDGLKTGGREPQSHSFNIDDYFDVDSSTNNNNDKAKQENKIKRWKLMEMLSYICLRMEPN